MATGTIPSVARRFKVFPTIRRLPQPALFGAGLMIAVFGCSPAGFVEAPLVESLHPPMVLVEGRKLASPSTGPGNRWVSGWLFDETSDGLKITPKSGSARLEIVHLRNRPRSLFLPTQGDATGIDVEARIGLRRLDWAAVPSGIEISLPADLARGRIPIDLEFGNGADVAILGASLSEAARAGRVTVEDDDLIQSPWSVVDFVRRVEPNSILVGKFVPPAEIGDGQRFVVDLDRGAGDLETVVVVGPSDGVADIRVPLRQSAGLIRVRLVAEGKGQAGRWRGLRVRRHGMTEFIAVPDPPAAPDTIVVYVLDALRADFVGHLGSDVGATPCIDRLAAEGGVFADHFSVAPNTGPATTSLFTGFGFLRGRSIPDDVPTLAEAFTNAGYRTVSISSNPHLSRSFGLTRGFSDVLFEPIEEEFRAGGDREPTVNDSAERVHRAALEWLDGVGHEDRVFLYIHTLNPHNPYTPPEPFPSMFLESEGSTIDAGTGTLAAIRDLELAITPEDERRIREWYTAGVAYNDAELCAFVADLERRFGDDFLLVVTSDHGEELFDHRGVLHGYTLYDELLHVPLVMWWPARIPPVRIERTTGTLDLVAALQALTAADSTEVSEGSTTDLWAVLAGDGDTPLGGFLHFATAPGLRRAAMVRSSQWKLVLVPRPRFAWGMGKGRGRTHDAEYLFDLIADPEERINRAGVNALEVDWLRSRLQGWVRYWERRQSEREDGRLDETTRRQLEALGYVD